LRLDHQRESLRLEHEAVLTVVDIGEALDRRRQSLVDQGQAVRLDNGSIRAPKDLLERLERTEIERVGRQMAAERGLSYTPSQPGEYVTGSLKGGVNLASGRFAMLDDGIGFQLVPWHRHSTSGLANISAAWRKTAVGLIGVSGANRVGL
jgi:hypothetical protein